MKIDIEKIEDIVRQASKECILPYFKHLKDEDISTKKNEFDFVTIADKKTEEFITSQLNKIYPNAVIIGEESVANNPSIFKNLDTDQLSFVIDPVDGTRNFKEGKDDFGVMIGCGYGKEIVAGIIYLPIHNKVATCEKGSGVYINEIRQKIIENTDDVSEMTGKVWGKATLLTNHIKKVCENRCAALSHIELVENKLNFICDMAEIANPWDFMPGILFANEAGGCAKTLSGDIYDYTKTNRNILITDSEKNFNQLQELAYKFL